MTTGNLGDPQEHDGGDVNFAVDLDGQPMFCTISREALDDHFDRTSYPDSVKAYLSNSEVIQAKAMQAAKLALAAGATPTKSSRLLLKTAMF